MSANRVHSSNCRWLTPPEITDSLGPFDLDPCADVDQPWSHALVEWTIDDDGLSREWFGNVWLNPPYGRETCVWLERLASHGSGIALVFARTDTKMFHDHVWPKATAILFVRGRPHFYHPSGARAAGNSGGPLVLIAYGSEMASRLRECSITGAFVELRPRREEVNKDA